MGVLTADVELPHLGNPTKVPVAVQGADEFYAGALIFATATGAVPGTTAGSKFLGICTRHFTTTAANQIIEIYVDGVFLFPAIATVTVADMGSQLFLAAATATDNPADCVSYADGAAAAGDVGIGQMLSLADGGTRAWVQIRQNDGLYVAAATITQN